MFPIRTMFTGIMGQSHQKQSQPLQPNTSNAVSTYKQSDEDTVSFSNSIKSRNQPRFGMDGFTHPQDQPVDKLSYLDQLGDFSDEDFDFDFGNNDQSSSSTQRKEPARQAHNDQEKLCRERKKIDISYMEEQLKKHGLNPINFKPSLPKRRPKQERPLPNDVVRACRERKAQYLTRLEEEFAKLMARDRTPQMLDGINSQRLKKGLIERFDTLMQQNSLIQQGQLKRQGPLSFQEAAEKAVNEYRRNYDADDRF